MPEGRERPSRRAVLLLGFAGVGAGVGALAGGSAVARPRLVSDPVPRAAPGGAAESGASTDAAASASPGGRWLSGSSGPPAADGSFGRWRGADVAIIGTWADNNDAMVQLWQLRPDGELGRWNGPLDIAVGAIGPGESWSDAAAGAFDDRWRACLGRLGELRAAAEGPTYVRFAHESNGDWYPWQVDAGSETRFVTAWRRFRSLQRDLLPAARLVFCVNRETVNAGLDWRRTFPGPDDTDVLAVDYYNQFPFVGTPEEWDACADDVDAHGAPKGLHRHREFAADAGLPFAVSEWSGNADMGDSPVFVERMHSFFAEHGGDGPGRLAYEIQFNVDMDDNRWSFHPVTRMPASAEAYRSLW